MRRAYEEATFAEAVRIYMSKDVDFDNALEKLRIATLPLNISVDRIKRIIKETAAYKKRIGNTSKSRFWSCTRIKRKSIRWLISENLPRNLMKIS
jgi:hypothetical protein